MIAGDYLRTGEPDARQQGLPATGLRPRSAPLLTYALNYNLTGAAPTARPAHRPRSRGAGRPAVRPRRWARRRAELAGLRRARTLRCFILYLVLVMSGGFMLTSVSKEKENRTAEVLLVSLPRATSCWARSWACRRGPAADGHLARCRPGWAGPGGGSPARSGSIPACPPGSSRGRSPTSCWASSSTRRLRRPG